MLAAASMIRSLRSAARGALDLGRQALDPFPAEEVLGAAVGEAGNHASQY